MTLSGHDLPTCRLSPPSGPIVVQRAVSLGILAGVQSLNPTLESWFLHQELAFKVIGSERGALISSRLPYENDPFARARTKDIIESALAEAVQEAKVPSLNELHLNRELASGKLVWLEQAFRFRGIESAYYKAARSEGGSARGSLWAKLSTDPELRIEAELNASRVTSDTGAHLLSGTRRCFMLAYIQDVESAHVSLRPVTIGQRLISIGKHSLSTPVWDSAHVWPQQIDDFKDVDFSRGTKSDLAMLRDVPEEAVKHWFAEIIGEPEVPKDWGGEQYDLWTRKLAIEGKPVRAAIAFKGPAAFHQMQISDLGRNGDQIQRLAHSPADLLVVQHCHTISSTVEHMLRTYALSPTHVRRYMVIDGYATAAILKHFEYLPVT